MRLSVQKEYGEYVACIFLHNELVYTSTHSTRALATLDAWENALFIKDIATATEQSVEALVNEL
jgi:hypothetical protein